MGSPRNNASHKSKRKKCNANRKTVDGNDSNEPEKHPTRGEKRQNESKTNDSEFQNQKKSKLNCDNTSDCKNPESVSERKLKSNYSDSYLQPNKGYRFVSLDALESFLNDVHKCKGKRICNK